MKKLTVVSCVALIAIFSLSGCIDFGEEKTITMDSSKVIEPVFVETVLDPQFEVTINEPVEGEVLEEGDTIQINFQVENLFERNYEVNIRLIIENEHLVANESWEGEIEAGDTFEGSYTWIAEDEGDFVIRVSVHDPILGVMYDEDTVTIQVVEEEDTPGFTPLLFVFGAALAVVVYHKKMSVHLEKV